MPGVLRRAANPKPRQCAAFRGRYHPRPTIFVIAAIIGVADVSPRARRLTGPTTMLIGLISDTHGLMRESALNALRGAALILHDVLPAVTKKVRGMPGMARGAVGNGQRP